MEGPIMPQKNSEEEVNLYLKEAIDRLKVCFGVENLSNNELFILRKITKDFLERFSRETGEKTDLALIDLDPQVEISSRFLLEAYGIDPFIMNEQTENDDDVEGFNEYVRRIRERAHLI